MNTNIQCCVYVTASRHGGDASQYTFYRGFVLQVVLDRQAPRHEKQQKTHLPVLIGTISRKGDRRLGGGARSNTTASPKAATEPKTGARVFGGCVYEQQLTNVSTSVRVQRRRGQRCCLSQRINRLRQRWNTPEPRVDHGGKPNYLAESLTEPQLPALRGYHVE